MSQHPLQRVDPKQAPVGSSNLLAFMTALLEFVAIPPPRHWVAPRADGFFARRYAEEHGSEWSSGSSPDRETGVHPACFLLCSHNR